MKTTFIALSFLFVPLALPADTIHFTPGLKSAFGKIGELRFEEARTLIAAEQADDPDNLAVDYMKGALLSLSLFIDEDETRFDKQREVLEIYISNLEEASDDNPQKRFMISQLRLSMAILHGRFQNTISAGWQFYKAYHLLKDNYEQFPDYAPTYVPLGVLYVAIGSLPEGYQSIASVIGIKGDVQQGMKLLKSGYERTWDHQHWGVYQDYFGFVYSYIALELNGDKSISPETLGLDYSKSSYLTYMQARVEISKGNARKALNLLKTRPAGKAYHPFHYLDYYTGKTALAFSPDTARIYLKKYLSESTSGNYVKSSYRYLSWYAMLTQADAELQSYRNRVLREGALNTGADRQAYREAQEPFNQVLIRGRIYFDGGLYDKATRYMLSRQYQVERFTKEDQLEFYYRLGRIYQESGNPQGAVIQFKKALAITPEEETFAMGNSALQLGVVLEQMKQYPEARKYYRYTLKLKGFPFYEGLHQKAKAGLNRI